MISPAAINCSTRNSTKCVSIFLRDALLDFVAHTFFHRVSLRRSSVRTPPWNSSGRLRQVPAGEAQQKRGPQAQLVVLNNMDSVIHRRAASRLQNLVVRTGALEQRECILCAIQTYIFIVSSCSMCALCFSDVHAFSFSSVRQRWFATRTTILETKVPHDAFQGRRVHHRPSETSSLHIIVVWCDRGHSDCSQWFTKISISDQILPLFNQINIYIPPYTRR
jgi:hypothetical protein